MFLFGFKLVPTDAGFVQEKHSQLENSCSAMTANTLESQLHYKAHMKQKGTGLLESQFQYENIGVCVFLCVCLLGCVCSVYSVRSGCSSVLCVSAVCSPRKQCGVCVSAKGAVCLCNVCVCVPRVCVCVNYEQESWMVCVVVWGVRWWGVACCLDGGLRNGE